VTIVRFLAVLAVVATPGSAPPPLRGVPLTGKTGIRLLVPTNPPVLLDVDTGRLTRIRGFDLRDTLALMVLPVGRDAVVWVDSESGTAVPDAEIYVVRRGATTATKLTTAWQVAPAIDGRAIWVKSYTSRRQCQLREVRLDGRPRRTPRPVRCSTQLVDAGGRGLLVQGRTVADPRTGRTLLRAGGLLAMSGQYALTTSGPPRSLVVSNVRTGARWPLPWPSRIGGRDGAVVHAPSGLIALAFSDPAYEGGGTQVTDLWLLDPTARLLQHLPDMPSAVSLKSTGMTWARDGRLVMLAESGQRQLVAVWRPGEDRIQVRRVRLPVRNGGSDSFVVVDER
jgi:hypothetical protein